MQDTLNWAVLGTGVIANEMAQALQKMGKSLYAVGNRTHEKAVAFAEKYHVTKVYDDFHEMFTDPEIDIIYITTPHNTHIEFLRQALANGRHVLCEKSITLNSDELNEALQIAEKHHVILAEAMTIWHMPLYKKLWEIVSSGELGKVQMIQLNFGSYKEYDMNNRFFNINLAGGALLDIGVYAVSFARWFMSSKPDTVLTTMTPFETGVDESSGILLKNIENEIATISLTMRAKQPKRGLVACENGYIEVYNFPRADKAKITYTKDGHTEEIVCGESRLALNYEIRDMEEYVSSLNGQENLSYVCDVMDVLTEVQRLWGKYE